MALEENVLNLIVSSIFIIQI